jgi:hypothetical protein
VPKATRPGISRLRAAVTSASSPRQSHANPCRAGFHSVAFGPIRLWTQSGDSNPGMCLTQPTAGRPDMTRPIPRPTNATPATPSRSPFVDRAPATGNHAASPWLLIGSRGGVSATGRQDVEPSRRPPPASEGCATPGRAAASALEQLGDPKPFLCAQAERRRRLRVSVRSRAHGNSEHAVFSGLRPIGRFGAAGGVISLEVVLRGRGVVALRLGSRGRVSAAEQEPVESLKRRVFATRNPAVRSMAHAGIGGLCDSRTRRCAHSRGAQRLETPPCEVRWGASPLPRTQNSRGRGRFWE